MIMHNIIPVLIFNYEDDAKTYSFPEAGEAAKDNYWDDTIKRVM